MLTDARHVTDGSILVRVVRAVVNRLGAWFGASWLIRTTARLASNLAVVTGTSLLVAAVRTSIDWPRHSVLYRWLTKKPDREEVVLDLRESYTLGPVVALFGRLPEPLKHTWRASNVGRVFAVTSASARDAPVRMVAIVCGVAVFTNTVLLMASGLPSEGDLLTRVILIGLALAGTRSEASWNDVAQARTVRLGVAALEPTTTSEDKQD